MLFSVLLGINNSLPLNGRGLHAFGHEGGVLEWKTFTSCSWYIGRLSIDAKPEDGDIEKIQQSFGKPELKSGLGFQVIYEVRKTFEVQWIGSNICFKYGS